MTTWEYRCPILPDPIADEPENFSKYLGPNGKLYMGIWTLEGDTHNIYSDKVIAFRKEEICETP